MTDIRQVAQRQITNPTKNSDGKIGIYPIEQYRLAIFLRGVSRWPVYVIEYLAKRR